MAESLAPHLRGLVAQGARGGLVSWMRQRLGWFAIAIDTEAQDFVEYALLTGLVAVMAGALLPSISTSISKIFSRMGSILTNAAA